MSAWDWASCVKIFRENSTDQPNAGPIQQKNELLLYFHQYSIYSQKVLMALYEKGIPFDSQIINLPKGEQFSDWFLELNPRGEVPLLKDGDKVIPDSSRIIDYLEDNFTNGYASLMHANANDITRKKIFEFRRKLDNLPLGAITKGSFLYPELCKDTRLPFISPIRNILKEINNAGTLREHADRNPKAGDTLRKKAEFQEKKIALLNNKDEYLKILEGIGTTLDEVEKELELHRTEKWLCGDNFTVADISLAILLERLDELGLSHRFWNESTTTKRPALAEYYTRVKKHNSFLRTIPSTSQHLTIIANTQSTCAIVAAGILCSSLVIATAAGVVHITRSLFSR